MLGAQCQPLRQVLHQPRMACASAAALSAACAAHASTASTVNATWSQLRNVGGADPAPLCGNIDGYEVGESGPSTRRSRASRRRNISARSGGERALPKGSIVSCSRRLVEARFRRRTFLPTRPLQVDGGCNTRWLGSGVGGKSAVVGRSRGTGIVTDVAAADVAVESAAGAEVDAEVGGVEGEADVAVIGAGLGGLCAAAVLAKFGYRVVVCESHSVPGGAAHAFVRRGFHFDSGPSFHAGLSAETSVNPLKHVLDIVGEGVECVRYKSWIGYFPDNVTFTFTADREAYRNEIRRVCGEAAYKQWCTLEDTMAPVARAAVAIPAGALRRDAGNALTLAPFLPAALCSLPSIPTLLRPFSEIMDPIVSDPFLRRLMQLECFVLSGMLPDSTISAEIATMFYERNRTDGTIDYPIGGGGAIIDALVRGLKKHGGKLLLNSHVESILFENGRAAGLRLRRRSARTDEQTPQAVESADGRQAEKDERVAATMMRLMQQSEAGKSLEGSPGYLSDWSDSEDEGIETSPFQLAARKKPVLSGDPTPRSPLPSTASLSSSSSASSSSTSSSLSSPSSRSRPKAPSVIRATKAVLSNASIWDTSKLLLSSLPSPSPSSSSSSSAALSTGLGSSSAAVNEALAAAVRSFSSRAKNTGQTGSFMHLHLGIDATGLPSDLQCHHLIVNDWALPIDAPQNVVIISIPSVFDASLAPPGCHTVHVYTAGNEPYEIWEGLDRTSEEYKKLKEERSQVLWRALERVIPDARRRSKVEIVGTPLTHERYLRRHRGTYGPAVKAGEEDWPGPKSEVVGLLCCGDSTMPGIGVPAAAGSGLMAANVVLSVWQHLQMLKWVK